ncbi:hypothetical protein [Promicromonospora panici]|uniref:hypothetical protein n=1 Tax=Promicromonospora panici TaxID=2219658 RepID=UPI001A934E84|nr:hypothetical protein [Promicromonospora panici]
MDRNIRRALYTALVAGGIVLAGAAAAHAAERLPEPATQGATDAIEGSAATRGDLGAAEDAAGGDGAAGNRGPAGDVVGPEGILGSLAEGDVGGVVDGALGEDGLVDDLLGGLPPAEVPGPDVPRPDVPGPDVPGPEEPGPDGPGQEQPGTDGPGTDPGTDDPGPVDPGIDPGVDGPGTDEPGPDEPGTDEPGTDEPGTDEPGTNEPGTDEPETGKPGTSKPGTSKPGTSKPGTSKPGTGSPRADGGDPGAGTDRPGTTPPGTGSTTVGHGGSHANDGAERPVDVTLTDAFQGGPGSAGSGRDTRTPGTNGPEDAEAPAADRELPGGGVDITWGDKADAHRETTYDGSFLSGDGLQAGLTGTEPELESEPEAEARPAVVPGDADVWTGHMFTGQLSLISLLLGLGIAALRMRRR